MFTSNLLWILVCLNDEIFLRKLENWWSGCCCYISQSAPKCTIFNIKFQNFLRYYTPEPTLREGVEGDPLPNQPPRRPFGASLRANGRAAAAARPTVETQTSRLRLRKFRATLWSLPAPMSIVRFSFWKLTANEKPCAGMCGVVRSVSPMTRSIFMWLTVKPRPAWFRFSDLFQESFTALRTD